MNLINWGSKKGPATPTTTTTTIEQKVTTTTTKVTNGADTDEYGAIFKEDWGRNQAFEVKNETTEDTLLTEVRTNVNNVKFL